MFIHIFVQLMHLASTIEEIIFFIHTYQLNYLIFLAFHLMFLGRLYVVSISISVQLFSRSILKHMQNSLVTQMSKINPKCFVRFAKSGNLFPSVTKSEFERKVNAWAYHAYEILIRMKHSHADLIFKGI